MFYNATEDQFYNVLYNPIFRDGHTAVLVFTDPSTSPSKEWLELLSGTYTEIPVYNININESPSVIKEFKVSSSMGDSLHKAPIAMVCMGPFVCEKISLIDELIPTIHKYRMFKH